MYIPDLVSFSDNEALIRLIYRTLICIPIGGEMLEKVGKQAMVSYLGSVLILALLMFVMARWACLNYRWRWRMKIYGAGIDQALDLEK
jgi:hypothetical protein